MPRSFGIYKTFVDRLSQLGFSVVDLSYNDDVFKYRNVWDRFVNLLRKTFFKDKGYKNRLKFRSLGQQVVHSLSLLDENADYAFIIRADIYPKEILQEIVSHADKSFAYQWDGLERYPAVRQIASLFDIFYVFQSESKRLELSNFRPLHNFYFGHLYNARILATPDTFFFIGSFVKSRWEQTVETANLILQGGGIVNFLLFTEDQKISEKYSCTGVTFIHQPVDYEKSVQLVLESEYLVDFLVGDHHGLSIRVFEALGYRKKLVTNNVLVKQYDFYNVNNIYILGEEERSLSDFVKLPYESLPLEIVDKYNFDNWFLRVLEPDI